MATSIPKPNNKNLKDGNSHDIILSVASKIASLPLHYSHSSNVWGILTAISLKSHQRPQGIDMLLTSDEHLIGRAVADTRFRIPSFKVSRSQCKIYRKKVAKEDADGHSVLYNCAFLKDTSTYGTYLNWERLNKTSPESRLHHGDIISFPAPPQFDTSYVFIFREVFIQPTSGTDGPPLKRKAGEFGSGTKRLRGIGIGASECSISLDDFRSLQQSNRELRKQLEDQVATIDQLRNEHRAAAELHEIVKRNLKETISKVYVDKLKEMHTLYGEKQKEIVKVEKLTSEQKHAMVDLNERLNASLQSCTEANKLMRSQNASVAELKDLLNEDREQRKEDREKAVANLPTSLNGVRAEAQEELKRLSDDFLRRDNEQQETINRLKETEKKWCALVEISRFKLEDARQKLVYSNIKVCQLQSQITQEEGVSSIAKKEAREEACPKVSARIVEINAAMQNLEYEKRRLKADGELILHRESQLRAFYSTTEEISNLFGKQHEQLKEVQKTLEDKENYENMSFSTNLNIDSNNKIDPHHQETLREDPGVTEKHDDVVQSLPRPMRT